jgi:long-chain acyl-CoA synthetase
MTTETTTARPWLAQYGPAVPADLPLPTVSAIDQFRATSQRLPEQPAIHYFAATLRFRDLDRLSSELAAALQAFGVNKGDRVALFLQNVPQFWIAQLAAWKCGAIVVPLNPMFKAGELEYHLGDSGATVLVALESLYPTVAQALNNSAVAHVITTSELDFLAGGDRPALLQNSAKERHPHTHDLLELCAAHANAADPQVPTTPEDIAYLTYTSGTTGRPKGAMNSHSNVAYNAEVYRVWMELGPDDVVVGAAPLFHITGAIGHLAAAAHAGAPVILAYRFDVVEVLRLIEQWHGTFLIASITVYIALMNHPAIKEFDLSSLRKCFSGGAPIAPSVVEQFQSLTGAYIHNLYGLTETTSPSHSTPMGGTAPVDPESGALSVGVPIPGSLIKICDADSGADLPPGERGEIVTSGPMVVAGYWQKPEESAKAVRNGWLHTGDIGFMDEQGWFYIVDRKKDMIIASGYKVWPREVEDVLYQHPAVREAAVVGVPDAYRGETVKAFVSLKAGTSTDSEALIAFCKERMAAYKYPRQIDILPELPKTATGKILRRELRGK